MVTLWHVSPSALGHCAVSSSRVRDLAGRVLLAACVLLPAVHADAQAQQASGSREIVVRGSAGTCAACSIRVDRVAELRPPASEAALVSPFNFAVDSRGRILFADPFGSIGVRVFDADGRFVRTIGKRGQGPGEFMGVFSIAVDERDSIHVFHGGRSVFTPSGAHVRTETFLNGAPVRRSIVLKGGRVVANGSMNTPEAYGHPIHVVEPRTMITRSFGLDSGASSATGASSNERTLAPGSGDQFWASRTNRYRIERWSITGKRTLVIERQVDWFTPWRSWDSRSDLRPPPPRLFGVLEDSVNGRLWTLTSVADRNWRPDESARGQREGRMPTAGDLTRRFDSVVEVLDLRSGQLLASERFDQMFLAILPGGRLVDATADADGETVVRSWRLRLESR